MRPKATSIAEARATLLPVWFLASATLKRFITSRMPSVSLAHAGLRYRHASASGPIRCHDPAPVRTRATTRRPTIA